MRGAGIEEAALRKADNLAKHTSSKNLATLLPKIKKTHIDSNIALTGRQEKILAILKNDKLSPELNNSTSRKFFRQPSDL